MSRCKGCLVSEKISNSVYVTKTGVHTGTSLQKYMNFCEPRGSSGKPPPTPVIFILRENRADNIQPYIYNFSPNFAFFILILH